jgi:homocysteine S-methyltransferase
MRLAAGPPVLLDGATGTELERRGAPTGLPLWSAHALLAAPDLVECIHTEYALAGAEIVTANSFRTHARSLARGGLGERAAELTRRAVALARRAAERAPHPVWVAGSISPLEDCYRPDLVPDPGALAREHAAHARHLAEAGADLLLVETMNTVREAVAAARAARATGLPVWVSFVCNASARLLSGEPLAEALRALGPLEPDAVGVNCLPPRAVPPALPVLLDSGRPFFVYANLGEPDAAGGFDRRDECTPEEFGAHALRWIAAGAFAAGGCCGTRPDHVRAIARALGRNALLE